MAAKLSRSGVTSMRGKRTAKVDFTTDEETLARINLLAAQSGKPRSEFLNEIMVVYVYGPESVEKAYIEQTRMIAGRISGLLRDDE